MVGRDALHTATIDPGSFEPHPKRCIDDETVLLGDRPVPVADLIAAVLHRVAGEAARAAGGAPTDIVLTCPARVGGRPPRPAPRTRPRRRCPAPAWSRSRSRPPTTSSPSAATWPVGDTAVVYDFGAGTFDASVIRRTAAGIDVLATEGLDDCGGLDIDAAIVESLGAVAAWNAEAGTGCVEPKTTADRRASRQLWDNVRQAKEMLSRAATTLIHVPLVDVEVPIGREQLDEAATPVLDRTVKAVRAALRDGRGAQTAGAIFLCGGSSRMPAVTTVLHRAFGIEPTVVDQPELAVAEGSIQSPVAVVAPHSGGPVLADRRPHQAPCRRHPGGSWPTRGYGSVPRPPPCSWPRATGTAVFALSGRADDDERGAAFAAASASAAGVGVALGELRARGRPVPGRHLARR